MATMAVRQVLRIELPEELAQKYEIQAQGAGLSLEEYLAKRLSDTVTFDAHTGIYLRDADRHELMKLLGRNFNTPEEFLQVMRQGVTIKIQGGDVALEQTLLKRCQARAEVEHLSLADFIAKEAIIGLERLCGMR